MERRHGVVGSYSRPSSKGTGKKVLLVDGRQNLGSRTLERPVGHTRHPQRALFRLSGLGDIDPPNRGSLISLAVHGCEHWLNPRTELFPCLRYRLPIDTGSRACGNVTQILPHRFPCDMMCQGSEPEVWVGASFRCYPFESRCHGWLIFSLHRRPYPPVEWSPCFPQTVRFLPAASPCDRLSRSRSTISRSDFRLALGASSRCSLVGSYPASNGEPDGSPLFTWNPLTACRRYNPGSIPGHSP
jgi:hypothetical protein